MVLQKQILLKRNPHFIENQNICRINLLGVIVKKMYTIFKDQF